MSKESRHKLANDLLNVIENRLSENGYKTSRDLSHGAAVIGWGDNVIVVDRRQPLLIAVCESDDDKVFVEIINEDRDILATFDVDEFSINKLREVVENDDTTLRPV